MDKVVATILGKEKQWWRGEEVNKISVGIAKQNDTVPPRHCGRFLYPLIDKRLQALAIFGIDIVDVELDDDSVIVGRHCRTYTKTLLTTVYQ
ncbi:hypothetical protein D1872_176490 [compost metagenome]